MRKQDLRSGYIVTLKRFGKRIVLLDDKIAQTDVLRTLDDERFYLLSNYHNDLTHRMFNDFNIIKVENTTGEIIYDTKENTIRKLELWKKEDRLALYKTTLTDYEKGHRMAWDNATCFCFSYYFQKEHYLYMDTHRDMKELLPELYKQRKIKRGENHYLRDGDTFEGNADRVTALKNAIKELER